MYLYQITTNKTGATIKYAPVFAFLEYLARVKYAFGVE